MTGTIIMACDLDLSSINLFLTLVTGVAPLTSSKLHMEKDSTAHGLFPFNYFFFHLSAAGT